MIRSILVLFLTASGCAWAQQQPPELRLPRLKGDRAEAAAKASTTNLDPVSFYRDRPEAALAAFQAGYKAMTIEHSRPRAIRLFLLALRRDPYLAKALYNLGLLSVQETRWRDAASFYQAAQQYAGQDVELAKSAAAELDRVQLLSQLDATPEGRKRRVYDTAFLKVAPSTQTGDPIALLDRLNAVGKLDATRWEVPALRGVLEARLGRFPESVKALEDSARSPSAPPAKRPQLQEAAELARREAAFVEQVRNADALWEKQQYGVAAKQYSKAWEDSPGHVDVAMEAVTGFLMADEVRVAVQLLSQLRDGPSPEVRDKAVAMLRELGAISEDAKNEAARAPAPTSKVADAADRIDNMVGTLTTPQMGLAAQAEPPLINDRTSILPIPQDGELNPSGSDIGILSTESIFLNYQRSLVNAAPPAGLAGQAPASPDEAPAPPASPAPGRPALPRGAPGPNDSGTSLRQGTARILAVASRPPGAAIVFDGNGALSCTTPCQLSLSNERHTFVATLAGYHDRQGSIEAGQRSDWIQIAMDARRGQLTVESKTPGARWPIFVNGKSAGQQTPFSFTLDEGEYEIGVEVDGKIVSEKLTIKENGIYRISF